MRVPPENAKSTFCPAARGVAGGNLAAGFSRVSKRKFATENIPAPGRHGRGHGCLQAGPAMGLLGGLLGLKTAFVRWWLGR